jgi:hypothetical protein
LAADDWGAGLAGWNAKATSRSKSDGRRAKKRTVRLGIVVWDICIFSLSGCRLRFLILLRGRRVFVRNSLSRRTIIINATAHVHVHSSGLPTSS